MNTLGYRSSGKSLGSSGFLWLSTLTLLLIVGATAALAEPKEYLYVQGRFSGTVVVISVPEHEIVSEIPESVVGQIPDSIAASPDGRIIYVNRMYGPDAPDVLAISTKTEEVLWRMRVGSTPHHIKTSRNGRYLFVPAFGYKTLEVIDLQKREIVARPNIGYGGHSLELSPNGERVYVGGITSGTISVVDTTSHETVRRYFLGEGVRPFQISPDETELYVQMSHLHGFLVLDVETGRVKQEVRLPPLTPEAAAKKSKEWPYTVNHGMRLTKDGKRLFVAASLSDYVAEYSLPDFELVALMPTGETPGYLEFDKQQRFLYSTNRAENSVSVFDLSTRQEIKRIEGVGVFPQRIKSVLVPERDVD